MTTGHQVNKTILTRSNGDSSKEGMFELFSRRSRLYKEADRNPWMNN